MPTKIIEVENVSKLYKLGKIGSSTLSDDLNRIWHKVRGRDDPFQLNAIANNRTQKSGNKYVWSLKDINFSIDEGDVFGIIGNNGAGKSTLLKILSKITKPTKGAIHLNGRISSLLEVGTGFHPELTGRENIFLNGAILGMRKHEIKKHFDEIVEFSGVQNYIDTPVKRYSSGMYVRLAFAVGAHLEPDILIIDEVLAVGDADFQAKCLGKMKEVSKEKGRTVIFVSHNISAVKQLCTKGLLLENGTQKACGNIAKILSLYTQQHTDNGNGKRNLHAGNKQGHFTNWKLEGKPIDEEHSCYTGETCTFSIGFTAHEVLHNCEVRLMLRSDQFAVLHVSSLMDSGVKLTVSKGCHLFLFTMNLPVTSIKLEVITSFISYAHEVDCWTSTTKLIVHNNHSTDLIPGAIQPQIKFSKKIAAEFEEAIF